MTHPSLADQAVAALAAVRAMGQNLSDDAPERHNVRSLKRAAENIIGEAMRQAHDLAYTAEQMSKDVSEAVKDARTQGATP